MGFGENAQEEIGQHIQKVCLKEFFINREQENGAVTDERCIEYKESLLFRMGEIAACLYGYGNNPGESGKLMKQERARKRPYATGIGRQQEGPRPPCQPLQSPSLDPAVSSFGFWLHIKSPEVLLKSIAALASCHTHGNSLKLGPRLWMGTPGPV